MVPKYGCDSLLLGKHVYKNICAFTKNAGIRPEFYHIAYLDGENSVAIISLAQLNTLLEKGYNGIAIGEYPGKRPDLPNRSPASKNTINNRFLSDIGYRMNDPYYM